MFATDDTIVALATPEGRGALGVVRISGPGAHDIAANLLGRSRPLPDRRAVLGVVRHVTRAEVGGGGRPERRPHELDQVVATFFRGPRSYTGEDTVEFSAHGSSAVLSGIIEACVREGGRLAGPGEFTLRAFLNGRVDLIQAEAVADLVEAVTPQQARLAFDQLRGTLSQAIGSIEGRLFELVARLEASLDFPEEGYHFVTRSDLPAEIASLRGSIEALVAASAGGRVVREGRIAALVGRPNVGKSSLFNALVGADRAIVTEWAGTTRDLLTERVDVLGVPVTLVDSAGIQETSEPVEREGVERARRLAEDAELQILVLDRSRSLEAVDLALLGAGNERARVVVANKADQPALWAEDAACGASVIEVSALTGSGLSELRQAIHEALVGREWRDEGAAISNVRHVDLLARAGRALERAAGAVCSEAPEEFVLLEIREALDAMGEVTGRRTADDVLEAIFARFCIGK